MAGLGPQWGVWSSQASDGAVIAPISGVPTAAGQDVQDPPVAGSSAVAVVSSGDGMHLADAARGKVYVCFEGPLGAHLKSEVREKIWKGDRVNESKKEEEEHRRYRLIPRTFRNWLQAFAILARVVGEKAPENCSTLFCPHYLRSFRSPGPFKNPENGSKSSPMHSYQASFASFLQRLHLFRSISVFCGVCSSFLPFKINGS